MDCGVPPPGGVTQEPTLKLSDQSRAGAESSTCSYNTQWCPMAGRPRADSHGGSGGEENTNISNEDVLCGEGLHYLSRIIKVSYPLIRSLVLGV